MKNVDGVFDYRDPSYGNDSSCRMRVYVLPHRVSLVIATELDENRGPSITNSAEAWAAEACKEYSLDPERTYFVEHYRRDAGQEDTYDFIEFKWLDGRASYPKWRSGTKAEIERLTGEPV